jgi:predicted nucleic acid-binding Zn ribbon protein
VNCPKCGTWNPDDKIVCWRCQAELPRPKEQKKRRSSAVSWLWMWAVIIILAIVLILQTCSMVTQ